MLVAFAVALRWRLRYKAEQQSRPLTCHDDHLQEMRHEDETGADPSHSSGAKAGLAPLLRQERVGGLRALGGH